MTTSSSVPDPRRWWALFILATAQFLVILDTSIVGIALPALQRALGFDAAGLQWIFNAYVVAFGGLLLLGGRLADLFGPRRLFGIGFGILTIASLVAGIATTGTTLLIARAIQGAGAALIAPAALSMVMALFAARPTELRKALGFWGASAAAGGTRGRKHGDAPHRRFSPQRCHHGTRAASADHGSRSGWRSHRSHRHPRRRRASWLRSVDLPRALHRRSITVIAALTSTSHNC